MNPVNRAKLKKENPVHYFSKLSLFAALSGITHAVLASAAPSAAGDLPQMGIDAEGFSTREVSPPTYAFAKCVYQPYSQSSTDASVKYEWALIDNANRFRVTGHWWTSNLTSEKNMFIADQVYKRDLTAICETTLMELGRRGRVIDVRAAYDDAPRDYTIWSDFAPGDSRIDRIIVFGDSFSDTSRSFSSSMKQFPHVDSWTHGRFSNGKIWSEHVGDQLRLPVYSWAASDASHDAYYSTPSLRRQVSTWLDHMERVENYRPERSLFVIWTGMDDAANHNGSLIEVTSQLRSELTRIYERGGRHVAVMKHADLSKTPLVTTSTEAEYQRKRAQDFDYALDNIRAELKENLGLVVHVIDPRTAFHDMVDSPENHDFEVSSTACLAVNGTSHTDYLSVQQVRPSCTDASTHVFWDLVHPTTKAHEQIALEVAKTLKSQFAARLPEGGSNE